MVWPLYVRSEWRTESPTTTGYRRSPGAIQLIALRWLRAGPLLLSRPVGRGSRSWIGWNTCLQARGPQGLGLSTCSSLGRAALSDPQPFLEHCLVPNSPQGETSGLTCFGLGFQVMGKLPKELGGKL